MVRRLEALSAIELYGLAQGYKALSPIDVVAADAIITVGGSLAQAADLVIVVTVVVPPPPCFSGMIVPLLCAR